MYHKKYVLIYSSGKYFLLDIIILYWIVSIMSSEIKSWSFKFIYLEFYLENDLIESLILVK